MGRLTKDPEVRYSQGAEPVTIARYTLAVRKQFKREGEADADFINCVAIGKRGEFASKWLQKGRQVAVCGRLSIREYDGQDGKRAWFTEVVVDDQYFADSKGGDGGSSSAPNLPSDDYYAEEARSQTRAEKADSPTKGAAPKGFSALDENLSDDDLPF
jgi:single-strand DNA-binding protein